jgi:hypothetical protein
MIRGSPFSLVFLALALAVLAVPVGAGETTAFDPLPTGIDSRPLPDGLESADDFGASVALREGANLMAVGAPREDVEEAENAGTVHLLERSRESGKWENKIRIENPADEDTKFGSEVAFAGESLFISDPLATVNEKDSAGAVYRYEVADLRDGVREPRRIVSPSPAEPGLFGASIDSDGERLAVGERAPDKAYVYQLTPDPEHEETLSGEDGSFADRITLDGDLLLVGVPTYSDETLPSKAGAVFVYHNETDAWNLSDRLTSPNPQEDARFGPSAVDGDVLAVGAPLADSRSGQVHVFEAANPKRTNWDHQAAFEAHSPIADLGRTLDTEDETILAGASSHGGKFHGPGQNRSMGATYWFHKTNAGWEESAVLRAPVPNKPGPSANQFGKSVALANDTAAVGADAGADRRFTDEDSDWRGTAEMEGPGRVTVFGPDTDRDFLADVRERQEGTPLNDADPDDDGLIDGLEVVRWASNPFDPDTDNDTLEDGFEATESRTQLDDPDTDGDTFSDALEVHGYTVQGQTVLSPSDPNDHSSVPTPVGPSDGFSPLTYNRGDLTPLPPADQPCHWVDDKPAGHEIWQGERFGGC